MDVNNASSDPLGKGDQIVNTTQFAMLDMLIPGFSVFSSGIKAYLGIDLNVYIPLIMVVCGVIVSWKYLNEYFWGLIDSYLMSSVRISTDDEIYNMVMTWVTRQKFSQRSRRFIVNTNINSRVWFMWRFNDNDEDEDGSDLGNPDSKKKALQYTPSFGSHFFWYRGQILLFERHENREQAGFLASSEREHLSVSCFGRNPAVLKELLTEVRLEYMKKDEHKTLIYRGSSGNTNSDPSWQRCMSRSSRPFSTVILNEETKKELIDDVTDYLNPATRRWYANRGIPYRRGYLLYGPPGTGKSSLSLALAGYFRMRIYIVSLSSVIANEENLSSLFNDLPRRCVVLLEDIDSAGLTHTREGIANGQPAEGDVAAAATPAAAAAPAKAGVPPPQLPGRLSLSGLLNILDGVASQEGRVLIMTTNHVEKLDKALIRPGRVDMTVKFGLADKGMTESIFRAIYAPYEGELAAGTGPVSKNGPDAVQTIEDAEKEAIRAAKAHEETTARVEVLAKEFAAEVPELEFSPAEIQGLLLRHKRDPEGVTAKVQEWMMQTRKDRKEKEVREAEKRRKELKKFRKEEEKKKRKEEKRKAKKAKAKEKKNADGLASDSDSGSDSGSGSGSDSEDGEKETETKKKNRKDGAEKTKEEAPEAEPTKAREETDVKEEQNVKTDGVDKKKEKTPSDSGYEE